MHIPGAYNLSMHLPIIVGTVPFRRPVPLYMPPQFPILLSVATRDADLLPNISSLPDNSYPSQGNHASEPPPPYQENSSGSEFQFESFKILFEISFQKVYLTS